MDREVIFDRSRFHDRSRFRSSQVTRAFASVIRAVSQSAQCEVSEPDEVALVPDAISDEPDGVDAAIRRADCR
jgi:hypothetical protein